MIPLQAFQRGGVSLAQLHSKAVTQCLASRALQGHEILSTPRFSETWAVQALMSVKLSPLGLALQIFAVVPGGRIGGEAKGGETKSAATWAPTVIASRNKTGQDSEGGNDAWDSKHGCEWGDPLRIMASKMLCSVHLVIMAALQFYLLVCACSHNFSPMHWTAGQGGRQC